MTNQQKTEIAKRACDIIFANEGDYGSVNENDNGAVSIGKVQWHGNRAKALLLSICNVNQNQGNHVLGSSLYNEIKSFKDWGKRIVTKEESVKISNLLKTNEGKEAQDKQALSDVLTYINKGISYGLTNPEALIYFADGVNQYGTYSILWKNISKQALLKGGTLDAMYEATKANTQNYMSRRTKVYNTLKKQMSTNVDDNSIKIIPDKVTIKMIQKWCNDYCKANLVIDGIFGTKSKKGIIKALQHCLNNDFGKDITEDGCWSTETSKACQYVSSSYNKKSNLAFIAQCLLYINGYDPKGLDSVFGSDSTKATMLFQIEHNLDADGSVGRLTFAKLVA